MTDKPKENRGADWGTTGQAPFDEREGPMTVSRPQREGEAGKSAGGKVGGKETAADVTELGQAAGSPGGRGCATPYGGVQRVKPRTQK